MTIPIKKISKVLIYSPFSNKGHFSSWNELMKESFQQMGIQVYVLDELVKEDINEQSLLSKITNYFNLYFVRPGLVRSPVFGVPKIDSHYLNSFLSEILNNTAIHKFCPDLIIHNFLDVLDASKSDWDIFNYYNYYKWAGIHIRPRTSFLNGYSHLRTANLFGIMLLSELQVRAAYSRSPEIKYVSLPDIASIELPTEKTERAKEILSRSKGRKIIFMGGSIGCRKNIFQWFKLIKLASPDKYYFVQQGEINIAEFTSRGKRVIEQFMATYRENYYQEISFIPEEMEFNEIISISDIIYAVYKDFEGTSNMIAKSCGLQVPIFINENSIEMAPLLKEFSLPGHAFPRNAKYVLEFLEKQSHHKWVMNYENYNRLYNKESFQNALKRFIEVAS
jgi:hypothetical protein